MTTLTVPKFVAAEKFNRRIDMSSVATLVLAGGMGSRLFPLTETRCKPALPFGGNYRLIDIPLSNALHSGCKKVFVLSQFLATSLHRHLIKAYDSVELLSVEQKPKASSWYLGTADAVRQNIAYLRECDAEYFLILSGDQLYQMDFEKMAAYAETTDADLLIASIPVDTSAASRMGILKIDDEGCIIDFCEKPTNPLAFETLATSCDPSRRFLGSMGIYLFKREALLDLLEEDLREDFGKHLIPTQVKKGNTFAYLYPEYWEDIGTIRSFYDANIDLTTNTPSFNLASEKYPIRSELLGLFPATIRNSEIVNALVCEGSIISSGQIKKSIIGPRSVIENGTVIETSYLFGNDGKGHFIGKDCVIKKAIIDKNATIGNGVRLINEQGLEHYDSDLIHIRDGVIIVKQNGIIPDYFTL